MSSIIDSDDGCNANSRKYSASPATNSALNAAAPGRRVQVLAQIVVGLIVRVAIGTVGAQVEQSEAALAHERVHVAESRLALVQLHELHLGLDAEHGLELSGRQR